MGGYVRMLRALGLYPISLPHRTSGPFLSSSNVCTLPTCFPLALQILIIWTTRNGRICSHAERPRIVSYFSATSHFGPLPLVIECMYFTDLLPTSYEQCSIRCSSSMYMSSTLTLTSKNESTLCLQALLMWRITHGDSNTEIKPT